MAVMLGLAAVDAQTPAALPAFEAASVKINESGEAGGRFGGRPGDIVVTNYTLRDIIRNAYVLQRYQMVGGARGAGQSGAPDGWLVVRRC